MSDTKRRMNAAADVDAVDVDIAFIERALTTAIIQAVGKMRKGGMVRLIAQEVAEAQPEVEQRFITRRDVTEWTDILLEVETAIAEGWRVISFDYQGGVALVERRKG